MLTGSGDRGELCGRDLFVRGCFYIRFESDGLERSSRQVLSGTGGGYRTILSKWWYTSTRKTTALTFRVQKEQGGSGLLLSVSAQSHTQYGRERKRKEKRTIDRG
ncbi:hypothetical protein NDU88_001967 [Pleurodeles waltl]|uniref:Uncharacterized protein n=1 Tax=Pleurodeles waltl TaxID=8319 RepID=A0AAV7KRH6_PLEWA|nr:hypothetical protein NDU88_001967 [Pleurodeles waltl]